MKNLMKKMRVQYKKAIKYRQAGGRSYKLINRNLSKANRPTTMIQKQKEIGKQTLVSLMMAMNETV